jgi:hypothetical protein
MGSFIIIPAMLVAGVDQLNSLKDWHVAFNSVDIIAEVDIQRWLNAISVE